MVQITLDVVRQATTTDLLMASVESLRRGMNLWSCMDAVNNIVQSLQAAHHAWKARGVHIRCLVNLLLDVDGGRFLDDVARHQLIEDAVHFAQVIVCLMNATTKFPIFCYRLFPLKETRTQCRQPSPRS